MELVEFQEVIVNIISVGVLFGLITGVMLQIFGKHN